MAAGPSSCTFSAEEALLLLDKTLTDAESECFSEDSQLESGDEEEDSRVEAMLAGAYFEEHSSGPSTTPAERDSLLILGTEIEGRYIKLVAWMIFELQLFETQIMVAVIWTTEVSQNLKMFNYSVRAIPPMMNQFLSVVGVEEEEL